MFTTSPLKIIAMAGVAMVATTAFGQAVDRQQAAIKRVVDAAIKPLMAQQHIPGMAVGVTVAGKSYVFDYGVASKQSQQPVTRDTLFELGSVSKTLTATLVSYAQVVGDLALSDQVDKYLPSLRDSKFGALHLLDLGTHTPGGLPLQVPDNIGNDNQLMTYFKRWKPTYAPGTYRTYSNVGIGTLGLIAAKSMHEDFAALMQQRVFSALGMTGSYITVPADKMANYAQGYTDTDQPIRMKPGELGTEAYGVRATATDMIRFVAANMGEITLDQNMQRAISNTHTSYYRAGVMTQDLIWEQFPYPVSLSALLRGNSAAMLFQATPVARITPAQPPQQHVWINKTGSTNGFSAYVAFVPAQRMGIVVLANKSYAVPDRVTVAYTILTALAKVEHVDQVQK